MTSTIRLRPTAPVCQRTASVLFSLSAFSLLWCDTTSAVTLGFWNITGNSAQSSADGEAQLFVEVSSGGGTTAAFRFFNTGPEESTISEVYFDDGSLLGISSIIDDPPSVDFELDATPPDLPGGNSISPPFQVTAGFLAQADNPAPVKGVDPDEEVTIMFDLMGGKTIGDVIDDLASGALRIGIHVISFSNGQSESFVNNPVPEPNSLTLLLAASCLLAWKRRPA